MKSIMKIWGKINEETKGLKNEYWDNILTGDVHSIPSGIREQASQGNRGEDYEEKMLGMVMRSWVVDHTEASKEETLRNWDEIRQNMALELAVEPKDNQLFYALSEKAGQKREFKEDVREQLDNLYSSVYEEVFKNGAEYEPDFGFLKDIPEQFQLAAENIVNRAKEEALAEVRRLEPAAEKVWKGVEGVLINEMKTPDSWAGIDSWEYRLLGENYKRTRLGKKFQDEAVELLMSFNEADRNKIYRMLQPRMMEIPEMGERLLKSLNRGLFDLGDNIGQLTKNTYAKGIHEVGKLGEKVFGTSPGWTDRHFRKVSERARISEELKRFAREEIDPVNLGRDSLGEQVLLDIAYGVPTTALAFGGPLGIGLIAGTETGRHMSEARFNNPAGDYDSQMIAAAGSGTANAMLSMGMTRVGIKIFKDSFKKIADSRVGAVLLPSRKGAGKGMETGLAADVARTGEKSGVASAVAKGAGNFGLMSVENKLQQEIPGLAQDIADGSITKADHSAMFDEWWRRQLNWKNQMREAGSMLPILMIAGGRMSLRHFRDSRSLIGDGSSLERLGVPQERIEAIVQEKDIDRKTTLLRKGVTGSRLWGSMYLGKKAFEWAKILDGTENSHYVTEKGVRDFLDMGPVKTGKRWVETNSNPDLVNLSKKSDFDFNSLLVYERWKMRSGLPQIGSGHAVAKTGGSKSKSNAKETDPVLSLKKWELKELKTEAEEIRVKESRNHDSLPIRLQEKKSFDPDVDTIRKQYFSERLQDVICRPYKMLMLKYSPETIRNLEWDIKACDKKTISETEALRSIIYEGVVRMAEGQEWKDVSQHVGNSFWKRWVGDDSASSYRNKLWLEDIRDFAGTEDFKSNTALKKVRDVLNDKKSATNSDYAEALNEISEYCAKLRPEQRELLPNDLRQVCRFVWKTQGDVRTMFELIPNLSDFDVLLGRGYGPDQAYTNILQKNLEIKPETVRKYASGISMDSLNPGGGNPRPYKYYHFMDDAVQILGCVSKDHMQKTKGSDGKDYWRVKYPNGKFSAWHKNEQLARQDLAGHLSTVFSPEGIAKKRLIPYMIRNRNDAGIVSDVGDPITLRLKQGKNGGVLFDDLSARAAADLASHYYEKRSMRLQGEDIYVHGDGTVDAQKIRGASAIRNRGDIYEKYVGPIVELGIDASNETILNMKGLLRNRIDVHNDKNPLALIEDKAEIIWDRAIRSGQLGEAQAWNMLHKLGRIDDPAKFNNKGKYPQLIEELSQLSKEYYLGNLNHSYVPESVATWARYAVARPMPLSKEMTRIKEEAYRASKKKDKEMTRMDLNAIDEWVKVAATEELRNLAKRGNELPSKLEGSDLPGYFKSMLRDSTGMNEAARVERFWALKDTDLKSGDQPIIKRYLHSLHDGRILDVLPEHVTNGLSLKLAELAPKQRKRRERKDSHIETAKEVLENMAERIREFPELNMWNYNPKTGKYMRLVNRADKALAFDDVSILHNQGKDLPVWDRIISMPEMKRDFNVIDDYYARSFEKFPSKWEGRPDVVQAIEALSIVRSDLASRPLASEGGIKWKGETYHAETLKRPSSIPETWLVDSPLMSGIEPILEIQNNKNTVKNAHTPTLMDSVAAVDSVRNCVKYINPDDSGHTIRLMPGMAEAPNPEARFPHVIHCYNGIYLDVNGNPVPPNEMKKSYIPLEQFKGEKINVNLSVEEILSYRRSVRKNILDELSDPKLQQQKWWDSEKGDSTFNEAVIRLYEESGMAEAYSKQMVDIDNPAFVETLRFVSHVLDCPGTMGSSLEGNSDWHGVIIKEAKRLKELYQEAEGVNGEK